MTQPRLGDRTTLGTWALQDHQSGLGVADRHYLVGARLVDPGPSDDDWFHVFDESGGKPVVGDIHPWRWWAADSRDHGAFAQAMVCRVTSAGTSDFDAQGRQVTGSSIGTAGVKPVRTRAYAADGAFAVADHVLPTWWPRAPNGFVMLGAAGTHEHQQENVLGWLDPRMVAADRNGHNLMGSRIIDLDPENEASERRSALLQTHARVAHVMAIERLGVVAGWAAAWHLARTRQGDEAGLGAVYGELDSRRLQVTGGATPGGVITEGTGPGPDAYDRAAAEAARDYGMALVRDDTIPNDGRTQGVQGTDAASRGGGRARRGKTGVALASRTAWGPFHLGHEGDAHRFGTNDDGEPVNSLHMDPDRTLWYRRQDRDAPLEFDTIDYGPSQAPMRVRAWIRYDGRSVHGWHGEQRPGLWRLEAESFAVNKRPPGDGPPTTPSDPPPPGRGQPPVTEPPRPVEPTDPPTPQPDPPAPGAPTPVPQPPTGQPGASPPFRYDPPPPLFPGPSIGPGVSPPVGPPRGSPGGTFGPIGRASFASWRPVAQQDRSTIDPESVAYSPMQLGFPCALIFPQHVGSGAADLRYSAQPRPEDQARAIRETPAVARFVSWGYQTGQGWAYTTLPGYSRVPGGTASGGMLVSPPEVDEADYGDSYAPTGLTRSTTYFGWAPGAYAAWGINDPTTGDLSNGSWRSGFVSNTVLWQQRVSGSWTTLLTMAALSGGAVYGKFSGVSGLGLPVGTTAERHGSTPTGMVRFNSDLTRFEGYDGSSWQTFAPAASMPSAASSVTNETTFGISAAVGASPDYARADHTHGSPPQATGWTTCTGTLLRGGWDTGTVTGAQLIQTVAALVADMRTVVGILGA